MAWNKSTATLTVLLGTVALLGSTFLVAASAQNRVQEQAVQTQQSGGPDPDLKTLIDNVEHRTGGKVLGIEREDEDSHAAYEVELRGKVRELDVDAAGNPLSGKEDQAED